MKNLFTLSIFAALTLSVFAQAPQKLSYQAVIRNNSGGLVTGHAVGMKISILQGSPSGTAVYVETHTTTTNANGLATVEIGGGSVVSGTFATINWGSGTYYLKTEADPAGGSSYTIVGTSQLLSVPYALFSKSAADGVVLPYSGSATPAGGGAVFQVTDNNTVGGGPMTYGLRGVSNSDQGIGVMGEAKSTSGTTWGIYGTASSRSGIGVEGVAPRCGVYGFANSNDIDVTYGVWGVSFAASGYGIYGESPRYGIYGTSTNTSGIAVKGEAIGTASVGVQGFATNSSGIGVFGKASVQGVYGEASSSTGKGIAGYVTSETGVTYGIYGMSASVSGYGVYGKASSATGTNYGVCGETASADGYAGYFKGRFYETGSTSGNTDLFYVTNTGTGRAIHAVAAGNTAVWGVSTTGYAGVDGRNTSGIGVSGHSATNSGVYGHSDEYYGVFGHSGLTGGRFEGVSTGVYGISTGTAGINYGVYGKTNSSAGYAGYFEGNVKVTGTLSKGGGSFEIDHPLDPANKILRHSFVESPDMMNVYNGNIRTDSNGNAEVILPDYFEALNRDFRYQLTVIGEFAQVIIAEKVSNNRFAIRTDKPDVEVSWQVTGIRKDPWAAENRIVVEEKKNQTLQGHYLYPELYNNPENRSVVRNKN